MDEYPRQYVYRQVVKAKMYIDANFAEELGLRKIAGKACLSMFHFSRLFREMYGITPRQYLTHVRIEKAKLLLEAGQQVKTVCFDVGFDSVTSFTGLFGRRVGETPAAYQRQRLSRKEEIITIPLKHIPNCFAEKGTGEK